MENNLYLDRQYIIFNISELPLVDFTKVLETSEHTIRTSTDGIKTFIKFDNVLPEFVNNLTTKEGPYSYDEMLNILSQPEWCGIPNFNI